MLVFGFVTGRDEKGGGGPIFKHAYYEEEL